MSKRNFLIRFLIYYHKNGFLRTLRRFYEQRYHITKSQMFLYFAEMNEVHDSVLALPSGVIVESKKSFIEAIQPDMQRLVNHWEMEHEIDKTKERFEKGAILWIIKFNGQIAGYGWSVRGKMVVPWYLPLTPYDAVLFDYIIFEEYRGCGLYKLLLNYILGSMKLDGVGRAYGFVFAYNTAGIHGIEKTLFRRLSIARKFHSFGRNVTIWT